MVKIIVNYGVMSAGKSTQLLTTEFQFSQYGIETYCAKPKFDTRETDICSRTGLRHDVDTIIDNDNPKEFIKNLKLNLEKDSIIFLDEGQFISYDLIKEIGNVCHSSEFKKSKSKIFVFMLLKDYNNHLFDGSRAWLEVADKTNELKSKCEYGKCQAKATCNYLNHAHQTDNNIVIGDDIYKSYCSYHYHLMEERG